MKKRTPWKLIPLKSVPIFILLLLSLGGTQAFSFSPTVVLGGRLDQVFSPQSAALWGDMYGFGSWRTTLGSEAYAVFNADSSFSLPLDQQAASVDQHSLSAQVGLSLPRGSLLLSSETFFSIKDPLYGLTMLPDWRGRYGIALDQKSTKKAYVGYSGSYLYQEKGTEDRLSQSTAIGFIYEPSFTRSYRFELNGSLDDLRQRETSSGQQRRDYGTAGEFEVSGLAGYFMDWSLQILAGARLSNDPTYEASIADLEAQISWGPTRNLNLSALLYGEGLSYWERTTEDGSDELTRIDIGGQVELDWTFNNSLYYTVRLTGAHILSNEPSLASWDISLGLGIEWGF